MSTRAIVARPTDDGWEGIYNHSDGYPTHLGKTLHNGCREFFDGNVERMLKFLLDEHPSGWSSLGNLNPANARGFSDNYPDWANPDEDPAKAAAYREFYAAPRCYCHSERADHRDEGSNIVTHAQQKDLWDIAWTYICTPDALMVFQGCSEMTPAGAVEWDQEVPDERWTKIECGEHFERCSHYAWVHVPNLPDELRDCSMGLLTGARQPEPNRDEIGYRINGAEVKKGGHGCTEQLARQHYSIKGAKPNGHRWFQEVIYPNGTKKDVPVFNPRTGKFCAGVEPIYPPTLDQIIRDAVAA